MDTNNVYCPDTNECYYFDPNLFNKTLSLRVEMPKNNQKRRINFAHDFREVP
ncbi:MAG: group I intron-associated PD-(D/E)XK endonuclease [Bacteroidota bacterium]